MIVESFLSELPAHSWRHLGYTMFSDDEIRIRYGSDVVISRSRGFRLVHLDRPEAGVVEERTISFDPDVVFEDGCPLCELQRCQRICLFDSYPDEDETVQLE